MMPFIESTYTLRGNGRAEEELQLEESSLNVIKAAKTWKDGEKN